MNLLTFLGTADYKQTTYTLDGKQYPTCYCPAATAHFYCPEKTLVVVTEAAEAKHFKSLADEVASVTQPVPIPIPDGQSEDELWQIFNQLTAHVTEGNNLVVDITNGFRSLPFLSFLAIVFLRLARKVKVRRVLYGAWEARNKETNETPVFDLTPFVTLLDWTVAADRFTRFGDASDLAALLRQGIPTDSLLTTSQEARQLRDVLKPPAQAMEAVSLAMRLTRPLETMTATARLSKTLQNVNPLVYQNAPPFATLAEQIWRAYDQFALADDPLAQKNYQANLQIQLDLIKRYFEQGQVVQGLTLTREWLVSALVYHFQCDSLIDYDDRRPVENALNNEVEGHKPKPRPPLRPAFDDKLRQLPNHREIGELWSKLTILRNDIAHVGMNREPKEAEKIRREANNLYPRLEALAQKLDIKEPTP